MSQRLIWKARDLASHHLHGEVEGLHHASHSLVINSLQRGEETIQHHMCTFGGMPPIRGAMRSLS